ncbi:PREDICTED: sprouty-related, EVH1 domain-containing protein 2-like [Poecilia mexicana]|uniref:sprouty-related, EVH1 domain-containing protein 2-like n=1 Tax=Poecilia mexicana TaxID=48701 RepID=UPI00072EEB14|nr:PREDICTED: sprouty-related, EVH1 domain-containing protein 2-like [Poecilia mexicana]
MYLDGFSVLPSPPFVLQTATDSSSNSSQRREPAMHAAPAHFCEPRRHHCILGHFYEHHRPSDHYFLDPAVHIFPRHASFPLEDQEIVRFSPRERSWLTGYEDYRHANATRDKLPQPRNPDTCVHFTKSDAPKRDYTYPYPLSCGVQQGFDSKPGRLEAGGGRRAVVTLQPRPPASKGKCHMEDGERLRCVYCQDMFNHEDNGRGQCQEAPDPIQTCIRRVSFMWCADSLLYHCMSDPEGDYSDPCSCDTSDERFCLRWTALVGLSLLAPCMCCYAPLRACHRCGVACRCCGGKHRAVG